MTVTMLDRAGSRPSAPRRRTDPTARDARLVPAGRHVYRQGDAARHVFELVSGVLRVARTTEGGRRQVVAFAYPGDMVGLAGARAHADECEAIADARVRPIDRTALDRPGADPGRAGRVTCAALSEIERMQDHFVTLGRRSAVERVALFLSRLAARSGRPAGPFVEVALPMRRADIADHLGLTIETVSRSLTHLRRHGLIALRDARTVIVPDPAALAEAAEDD
jgi:CRP-like cAMP-binding protein